MSCFALASHARSQEEIFSFKWASLAEQVAQEANGNPTMGNGFSGLFVQPLVLQSHLRKKRGKMGEGVRSYECRTTNGARSERGGGRAERHQPGSRPAGRAVWSDRVTCSTCRGEKARWALLARAARAGGAQERLADGRGTGRSERPRGAAAVGGSGLG